MNSTNNHIDVRVDDIAAAQSPWQLWRSAPNLGTIKVDKPHVLLELPLDVQIQERHSQLEPTFTAVLKDAALTA